MKALKGADGRLWDGMNCLSRGRMDPPSDVKDVEPAMPDQMSKL